MGVPYGGIRVVKDAEGCADAKKLVETWKNRFVKVLISCKNIVDKIRENSYADEEMFKMDFAMLFIATVIASTKNGHTMYKMLGWFCLSKEFREHDWCQFIMDTIRVCKSDWDRSDHDSFFRYLITVLVLLYLDNTTCPRLGGDRLKAPISFWTKNMMSMRKDLEIRNEGFGLGDVRELYADDQEYEQLSEDEVVDLSKGDKENVSAGFDGMSLEDCVAGRVEEKVGGSCCRSCAYDTQRRDDMPSFDLGLSQPLPSTQELMAMREETVENDEPEADVGGKGKRKNRCRNTGNLRFCYEMWTLRHG
ncbi:hypothetical protein Hdeb2414_s0007g00242161 [Helianthus debilis subsp. tardiflorus]